LPVAQLAALRHDNQRHRQYHRYRTGAVEAAAEAVHLAWGCSSSNIFSSSFGLPAACYCLCLCCCCFGLLWHTKIIPCARFVSPAAAAAKSWSLEHFSPCFGVLPCLSLLLSPAVDRQHFF